MASSSATNPDTPITVKVNIDSINRRFKLPLRDLGPNTLTDKLRFLLSIPSSADVVFERYSDSAAAFVVLDPNNASVYKQLYRAAKAKLKLRLKVTVTNKEPVMPRPATVEDEAPSPVEEQPETRRYPSPPTSPPLAPVKEATPEEKTSSPSVAEIQRGFEDLLSRTPCSFTRRSIPTSTASEIPVTRGVAARDKWFAELASVCHDRPTAFRTKAGPPDSMPSQTSSYSVYCNNCNEPIPDEHYHCSTCDDGDYDLCQGCIDRGVLCGGERHWMIKRFVKNGKVITSTTETLAPKVAHSESKTTLVEVVETEADSATRTCNSCIQEFPEENFVTCTACDDYDLCMPCHVALQHGHNPKHALAPAVENANLDPLALALLQPGRNTRHHAICDGCDKYIYGVRHKCLDCPDWDYCAACIVNANFIHPRHRFVPIYEPISEIGLTHFMNRARHHGIYCDGPLCGGKSSYIVGDRYKCAVCHDTDFCASCEASPSNLHNKTHPLIKFKTMVRSVNVTTTGDHDDGTPMPVMGDRRDRTNSKFAETTPTTSTNAATQVQTVADLHPSEPAKAEGINNAEAEVRELKVPVEEELVAHFVRDAVPDGTVLPPNCVFEQTWILRNGGNKPWPAGCTVKFVGGDNMCAVDPEHPASIHELVAAAESTTCYSEVAPDQEFGFTVLMRTPPRAGKVISYWRLTGPTGNKFGHRLWCDVTVEMPNVAAPKEADRDIPDEEPKIEVEEPKTVVEENEKSQMIFPKLEKESPTASFHEEAKDTSVPTVEDKGEADDMLEFSEVEDDDSEDGFLTDEEYDILDASDEEYLAEQKNVNKK